MKKLPEDDLWNGLKDRLGNYTEEPEDDAWDKIAGALPQKPALLGLVWIDRITGLSLVLLFAFMTGYMVRDHEISVKNSDHDSRSNLQLTPPDKMLTPIEAHTPGVNPENINPEQSLTITDCADSIGASSVERNEFSDHDVDGQKNQNAVNTKKRSRMNGTDITLNTSTDNARRKNKSDESNEQRNIQESKGRSSESPTTRFINSKTLSEDSAGEAIKRYETTGRRGEDLLTRTESSSTMNDDVNDGNEKTMAGRQLSRPEHIKTDSLSSKILQKKDSNIVVQNVNGKAVTAKKTRRGFHPQVYIGLTPSLVFNRITPSHKDELLIEGLKSPGIISKERFGISLDAGIQQELGKNFEMYAGVLLYRQKQKIAYAYQSPDVTITKAGQGSYDISHATAVKEFEYTMLNVGASAGFLYRIMGDKLMHKAGAGIQYQQGMLSRISEHSYDNKNSSYLDYQLMYRFEFLMNTKLNIFIQPTFTHTLQAHEKLNEPFTIKRSHAGIKFGLTYQL